jgi:Mn-dependent DtxR family transcriptional regulator
MLTTIANVASEAHLGVRQVQTMLNKPSIRKLVQLHQGLLALTSTGTHRAAEMVRAHRLWESFLADQANLSPEFIHEAADRLEHAHELSDEVDAALGHPKKDPHGATIPSPAAKSDKEPTQCPPE